MVEDFLEEFMHKISMVGNIFESCLENLMKENERCVETNLFLNWKKWHFMVKESITLLYKISGKDIQLDNQK